MRFSAGPPGSPGRAMPGDVALHVGGEDGDARAESCSASIWSVIVLPVPVAPATRPWRFIIRSGICTTASGASLPSWTPRPEVDRGALGRVGLADLLP